MENNKMLNERDIKEKTLELENKFLKNNIKKMREIIGYQEKELQGIKNSKGYRMIEILRKLIWWRK